ncbi:hypothetical protein B0H63DRAFT_220622 [Podospora didyma]|uniref:Amidoligase enzyme n=1 Tax=Podospora didyma TaxID=330526 RepID=A0AAE0KIV0_9PEZI|nr:hypothetical protein B0H63DRAFT_220622 [Podospora didyma]
MMSRPTRQGPLSPPPSPLLLSSPALGQPLPQLGFHVGIETELFLERRIPRSLTKDKAPETLPDFSIDLRDRYMQALRSKAGYPGLRSEFVEEQIEADPLFSKWCVINEISLTKREQEPWGLEIVSPKLPVSPSSHWREHVNALWAFLDQNYSITGDDTCGTHIHISVDGDYDLSMMKAIASAVIYFEPAIEALLPETRRGNHHTMSNWIDNPSLGHLGMSRAAAIQRIKSCKTHEEVIYIVSPGKPYGWNFKAWSRLKTIEFRRGAPSQSADDVFMWADFVMAFVKAALSKPLDYNRGGGVPYAPTIGGLFDFFADVAIPDGQFGGEVYGNSQSITRMFGGRQFLAPDFWLEPIPYAGEGLAELFEQEMHMNMWNAIDADDEAMPERILRARQMAEAKGARMMMLKEVEAMPRSRVARL